MSNRAIIRERQAYLSTPFGESFAARFFTPEQLASIPRYVKGKRKGLMKGEIIWKKCEKGGWVSTYGGTGNYDHTGYVQAPGLVRGSIQIIVSDWATGEALLTLTPAPRENQPDPGRHGELMDD